MNLELGEAKLKIQELHELVASKDDEIISVKSYLETFEEENRTIQNQMLDEKLSKEEAIKQLEAM
jgi:hypothetical protein